MAYGFKTVQEFYVDDEVRSRLTHELINPTYEDVVAVQDRMINGVIDLGKERAANKHDSELFAAYRDDGKSQKSDKKR